MRLLVSEKRYETAVASGAFRYERDATPIGIIEKWRRTAAPDNFSIVRVDLDQRALDGRSYLFHLVLDGDDQPERLVYRYLDDNQRLVVTGNVLFTAAGIVNRQTWGDETVQHEQSYRTFLLPGAFGLGLLAHTRPTDVISLAINGDDESERPLSMINRALTYQPQRTRNLIPLTIGNNTFVTTYLGITWAEQKHTIWRDKAGYPVQMTRPDGVTAVEVRPMRFK